MSRLVLRMNFLVAALFIAACQPIQPPTPAPTNHTVTSTPTEVSTVEASTVEASTVEVSTVETAATDTSALEAEDTEVEDTEAEDTEVEGTDVDSVETDAAAEELLQEGIDHHEADDYEQAIDAFTEAIQLNPNLTNAYVKRAAAYLRLGNLEAAIADCDEAIRLDPELADAYFYRGVAYAYQDEFEVALTDLTEAIRLNPESVDAHVYRGATYFFLEQYAATVQDCTDAVRLSGGYFLPAELCLNVMGQFISPDFEHIEAAVQDFDEAIRLDPHFAEGYLFRGLAKRTLGDLEGAIQDLEEALRQDPWLGDLLIMYWHLAYIEPADPDAAIAERERALSLVEPGSLLAGIIEIAPPSLRPGQ